MGTQDEEGTRSIIGLMGAVYLMVGLLGFVVPYLFGLIPSSYTLVDNLVHLAFGPSARLPPSSLGVGPREEKRKTEDLARRPTVS